MDDLTLPVLGSRVVVHPKDPHADWAEGWPGTVVDVNTSRFTIWEHYDYQVHLTGHHPMWFGADEIEVMP